MAAIREAIVAALNADRPMTVRQMFYRLVGLGAIEKTEVEYKATVCRLLGEMRLDGSIPYGWISDHTRWMRKPQTYNSLAAALDYHAQAYRRALWSNQDVSVQVWVEKDALAGVILEETDPYDVPLMVARGYSSVTYLHDAAQHLRAGRKPAFIYQLGDHDPSGVDAARHIERKLREFAPEVPIQFERLAVLPGQIEAWRLPTRPTKQTDSRARGFVGESVELDAIPASFLRRLVKAKIEQHVDRDALVITQIAEESEKSVLTQLAASLNGGGGVM